jgi:hypothetical protein
MADDTNDPSVGDANEFAHSIRDVYRQMRYGHSTTIVHSDDSGNKNISEGGKNPITAADSESGTGSTSTPSASYLPDSDAETQARLAAKRAAQSTDSNNGY